jgi:PAS domain S-box-containing protein
LDDKPLPDQQPVSPLLRVFASRAAAELERKRAEEALQNSRRRLALVLEATNEGLWDWNIKTGEVYYSPQWIESLGFTREEVPPHISFWESRVHPDDRPGVDEALRAHFSGQTETYQYENRLRLKSGQWRWNLDRGKVVEWDANGRPLRMVGTDTDITARKRSEEQLAKINACFLGFGVSPEQNITRLTALCGELLGAACALYNYLDGPLLRSVGQWNVPADFKPVGPAEGHICLDVVRQGEDRPVTVRNLQATPYAQSDPNVLPYNLQTYFGMAVNCQGSAVGSLCAVFQRDFVPSEADVKLLGIIAAAIGVEEERRQTEVDQKRLLEELADSRNRFEMFFRQTPSAISITTIKDGRFLDLNKQAELLTGYTRDELIGRTTVEMNLYVDPSERPGLVQELKQKGMLTDLEREIRTKSGEVRTAVFSLVPIHMGSEPCLLSIAHDITERKQAEQRLHERSRQQAIEAELSVLAVTIQDLPNLLSTAAGLVLNALEVNYCEVLELIPNATDLRLCASAGWRGDEVGEVRALETGSPAHAALNANKPVVRTLLKESRFGGPQWLHEHGVVTGMSVSIPGKDGPWGVLGVYAAATRTFSRDDVNFLQTVSSILGTAIERMQTETVLRSANQSLRQLSRQLLQVQEDDRRAIARDLHDEIGQSLTAIKLNVERAQRTADRDARAHIMRDCAQITERVLAQVRNLSLDLHPSILDDLGLAYALKWYADRQAERAGLKVDVTADPSLPRLPQDVEIACFRIVQEALTNVVRHAHANLAGVTLKRGAHALELCIRDDGIGFVVDKAAAPLNGRSSVGLASMLERAKLLGGTVKISSAPHCGTTVVATLPLPVTSPDQLPAEKARQR